MHTTYRDFVLARAKAAVEAASAAAGVESDVLRGRLREIFIQDLLQPLVPPNIDFGTGEIIASDGRTSAQQDVVMFDRAILPPYLVAKTGVFPIESVIYTFEVKSRLDADDFLKAHSSARSLQGFT